MEPIGLPLSDGLHFRREAGSSKYSPMRHISPEKLQIKLTFMFSQPSPHMIPEWIQHTVGSSGLIPAVSWQNWESPSVCPSIHLTNIEHLLHAKHYGTARNTMVSVRSGTGFWPTHKLEVRHCFMEASMRPETPGSKIQYFIIDRTTDSQWWIKRSQ